MVVVTTKKPNLIISILFAIIGIGLIVGGAIFNNSLNSKLNSWTHTVATVTSYREYEDKDSDGYYQTMYTEILEFTANGQVYSVRSNVSSSIRPRIGDLREIAYNPNNPKDIVLATKDNHMPVYILFIVGGVFSLLGISLIVSNIVSIVKKRKNAAVSSPTEEAPQDIYEMQYFDK